MHTAVQLHANDLEIDQEFQESLGVKVTTEKAGSSWRASRRRVAAAERVSPTSRARANAGPDIQRHEFNYALSSVNEGNDDLLGDLLSRTGLSPVPQAADRGADSGQRNYLEAIQTRHRL